MSNSMSGGVDAASEHISSFSQDKEQGRKKKKKDRQPGMKIFVHVQDKVFPLSIGSGEQDFRWLAVCAASRYAGSRPHGRVRHREGTNQMVRGNFIPIGADSRKSAGGPAAGALAARENKKYTSSKRSFTHPKTKLNLVLKDGDHVEVRLKTSNDEVEYTRFQSFAFHNSPSALARRGMEEKKRQKREAEEARRKMEETSRRRKANKDKLFGGFNEASDDEIDLAFEAEWSRIEIKEYLHNESELADISATFREAYLPLRAAFKYYSNLGNERSHADMSMSLNEFQSFISNCGLMEHPITKNVVSKIFKKVNEELVAEKAMPRGDVGRAGKAKGDMTFRRPEFMEALFVMARKKFKGKYSDDPSMQFDALMTQFIVPHVQSLVAEDFKNILVEEANAEIITSNIELLRDVYNKFTNVDRGDVHDINDSTTISMNEFEKIFVDAGMMDNDLNSRVVQNAFLDSQTETFDPALAEKEDYTQDQQMIFVEFIEAVARVAKAKWANVAFDVALQMCFETLKTVR